MGVDPISMGLMAGGQLLSTGGSIMNARESNKNATRQAMARNAVLREQNAKLAGFRDQNYAKFDANQAGYTPGAQEAQRAAVTAARQADSGAQIADAKGKVAAAGTGAAASSTPAVGADYTSRLGTEMARVGGQANAQGAVSGFGDSWLKNEESNKDLARNIDLTNNYARGTANLTAPLQDFAQTAATKAPSGIGTLLSGAGGLMSMYGAGRTPAPTGGLSTGGIFDGIFGNSAAPTYANVPLPPRRPAGL